jgi:hypothetical protein
LRFIIFTRVELTVHADNTRAKALYKRRLENEGGMNDAVPIDGNDKNKLPLAILNGAHQVILNNSKR